MFSSMGCLLPGFYFNQDAQPVPVVLLLKGFHCPLPKKCLLHAAAKHLEARRPSYHSSQMTKLQQAPSQRFIEPCLEQETTGAEFHMEMTILIDIEAVGVAAGSRVVLWPRGC